MNMKMRCYHKKSISYHNYGERGITICDEWLNDFKAFYDWANANKWRQGLEIDRIDNDGNYEPSNCRITTRAINTQNTRVVRLTMLRARHIRILYYIGRKSQDEIAYLYGVSRGLIARVSANKNWRDPDFPIEFLKMKHKRGAGGVKWNPH